MAMTVYVSPLSKSKRTTGERVYHSNHECQYVTESHVAKDKETLPEEYRECSRCSGEANTDFERKPSLRNLITTGRIEVSD